MRILYLDQNKWIELSRAVKSPKDFPVQHEILTVLVEEANAGRLRIPLTSTNLYETQKIDIPERRQHLAWVQATLSQGMVFRGRYKRLEVEVVDLLRARYGLEPLYRDPNWFLSNVFFEANAEIGDNRIPQPSQRVIAAIRSDPPRFMFDYLTALPENVRTTAVSKFTEGSEKLRQAIEDRRARATTETVSTRRKVSSARLILNELDLVHSLIRKAQLPKIEERIILRDNVRNIVTNCPTYFIEREIGLRIESQNRAIEENDFRDMQTFCAVLAYADIVVAENMFSNLAIQSGLHKRYGTQITTKLVDVPDALRATDDQ